LPGIAREEAFQAAREGWVEDQMRYYQNAIERHRRAARRWNRSGQAMLIVALIIAAGLAISGLWNLNWSELKLGTLFSTPPQELFGETLAGWELPLVQALLGVAAASGLVARAYLIRRADEDLVKQYSAALQIFSIAAREYDEAVERRKADNEPDWDRATVLDRLGREALQEHGEWAVLRHSRPYEVPRG
jgi:hypothetical protein